MIWGETDSSNLSKLLNTAPLIAKLNELRPPLDGSSIEQRAISSSERNGYERAINDIYALSQIQEPKPQPSVFVEGLERFEERAQPIEQ